jgi:hypothetical protein
MLLPRRFAGKANAVLADVEALNRDLDRARTKAEKDQQSLQDTLARAMQWFKIAVPQLTSEASAVAADQKYRIQDLVSHLAEKGAAMVAEHGDVAAALEAEYEKLTGDTASAAGIRGLASRLFQSVTPQAAGGGNALTRAWNAGRAALLHSRARRARARADELQAALHDNTQRAAGLVAEFQKWGHTTATDVEEAIARLTADAKRIAADLDADSHGELNKQLDALKQKAHSLRKFVDAASPSAAETLAAKGKQALAALGL